MKNTEKTMVKNEQAVKVLTEEQKKANIAKAKANDEAKKAKALTLLDVKPEKAETEAEKEQNAMFARLHAEFMTAKGKAENAFSKYHDVKSNPKATNKSTDEAHKAYSEALKALNNLVIEQAVNMSNSVSDYLKRKTLPLWCICHEDGYSFLGTENNRVQLYQYLQKRNVTNDNINELKVIKEKLETFAAVIKSMITVNMNADEENAASIRDAKTALENLFVTLGIGLHASSKMIRQTVIVCTRLAKQLCTIEKVTVYDTVRLLPDWLEGKAFSEQATEQKK